VAGELAEDDATNSIPMRGMKVSQMYAGPAIPRPKTNSE
jgi:hypothetical protein